ncbi:hypothetical protein STEG23_000984 [Scotinomys teguina]
MTSALENYINRILRPAGGRSGRGRGAGPWVAGGAGSTRGPDLPWDHPDGPGALSPPSYIPVSSELSAANSLSIDCSRSGTLKGFDQTINLILDESHERVFSSSQGVEQVVLGLYIVRGDNVAVIGEIDEETDSALDLGNIRAEPLNSVAH